MSSFITYRQLSLDQLRARAEKSLAGAAQQGEAYEPVPPTKRMLCRHWWGKAWCRHLERYADAYNRLERGKRYVCGGAVIDLKIRRGSVSALVQGTRSTPYRVEIDIEPLSEKRAESVLKKCGQRVETMEALINGDFPRELQEVFTAADGVFPPLRDIKFTCSCPDQARMCKHIAATLYAIGMRLDENPFFFFGLRGMDADAFIATALENKVEEMLANADHRSERMLESDEIGDIFGVL